MGEWINGRKIIQAWNVIVGNDVYSVPEFDYSGASTVVGWSSFTNRSIWVKPAGKRIFVRYYIRGVSNSGVASFTVPYTSVNAGPSVINVQNVNNGGWVIGTQDLAVNTKVVLFYVGIGSPFASSGTKAVYGQFDYEAA